MKVSVVVPTFNRSESLINLLKALEVQSYTEFEVIVINDGSVDDTIRVVELFKDQSFLDIKLFSIPNHGRAGSRNYGVEKSSGELLLFYDDDTRPSPSSIGSHVECHNLNDNCLISGPYLYDQTKFLCHFNYFRQWMEAKWISLSDEMVESTNLRINGGNCSIRRENFLKMGGFDERLRDKEDFKLAFDFVKTCKGKVYSFFPAWVYHDDFRGLSAYIERERSSRKEEQKLGDLDPEILAMFPERFVIATPKRLKFRVARFVRSGLFISFMERVLDSGISKCTSESLRNKIYDVIVTMNVKYLES